MTSLRDMQTCFHPLQDPGREGIARETTPRFRQSAPRSERTGDDAPRDNDEDDDVIHRGALPMGRTSRTPPTFTTPGSKVDRRGLGRRAPRPRGTASGGELTWTAS